MQRRPLSSWLAQFSDASTNSETRRRRLRTWKSSRLDLLEDRRLLAITPGMLYQDVSYTDADGDTVRISITGTITDPAAQGFTVELAGLALDDADATRVNLIGLSATNGVQIVVSPNLLPNAGPNFNNIYSSAYTNVAFLSAVADPLHPAAPMTSLGGVQLSAAVVHSIQLAGIDIGNITLDAGQAPFVDRINTTNNQQSMDSGNYKPVTGLIDLGGITAGSIDSLVINGAISAMTGNPFDTSTTNDFRSVITVSGRIGTVLGLRSNVTAAIRADSIGSVRVASIAGEISTRNPNEPMAINLPSPVKGFINVAGHLNLGFPLSDGALITGQINAGGGISGSDRTSMTDPLYLPANFAGSLSNTSLTVGIADIAIDGNGMATLYSASSIGNLSANGFAGTFLAEAGTSIGRIDASSGKLEGHLQAGTDIGDIKTIGGILGTMIAGGNIGRITVVNGSLESLSIQAGGNIGPMSLYLGMLATSIVAGGDIGAIAIPVNGIDLSYLRARDIGAITIVDGAIQTSSFVAERDIAAIRAFGSIEGFGISDVSIVAGRNIAAIDARAHTGYGIDKLKVEAGERIEGISGISYGEFGSLDGSGIADSNFAANSIGPIYGRGVGGTGIEKSHIFARTGSIDSITGDGWKDGLLLVTAVADQSIGSITGKATMDGSGIDGGSYDANFAGIGPIVGAGGSAGGFGIVSTRFQSTDRSAGGIASITASANANGLDAFYDTKVYAAEIGPVLVNVLGGVDGNGMMSTELRAYWGGIESITVNVRSINGMGIRSSIVRASGDIGPIRVVAFNNSAIFDTEFNSRGNFASIYAESQKNGNAIDTATFTAPDGSIAPGASIEAIAGGTDALSNGIIGSTFRATREIGLIEATARGGAAISGSQFAADSDLDNTGAIAGIRATASGRNLLASSGIYDSGFTGIAIGNIEVNVETVEGGTAIDMGTFLAKTAVYDGFGNFDNTGTIGAVKVVNVSGMFYGIDNSSFNAGSAGSIGSIDVTTDGGTAIRDSFFNTVVSDMDQNLFTSTIGDIVVRSGRTFIYTANPAGIVNSYFMANAGIASVTAETIGGAIDTSQFNADMDFGGRGDIPGDIGFIRVNVPGRNANGITSSNFTGGSIGNITVRLADNATTAQDAIRGSEFTALRNSIGNITVVNTGLGYALLNDVFRAAVSIGNVNVQGDVANTQFIITNSTIGDISIRARQIQNLAFQAQNFGNISLELLQPGTVSLSMPNASKMGNLYVAAPLGGTAGLTWNAPRLVQAGDVNVSGILTLQSSMTSLTTMGAFTIGSLAGATGHTGFTIGSTSSASSIGPIRIGSAPTGKAQHRFQFGAYGGAPNAVVGTASGNAKTGNGAVIGNVRFVLNQAGRTTAAAKPVRVPKPKATPLPRVSRIPVARKRG
jgi:hypothetical protein